jgi:hypothetical protein
MGIRTTGGYTRWLYLSGGLLLLLGAVHLAAAPGTLRAVPPEVPSEFKSAFLFMFCAAGLAVLLSGGLVLWSAYGLARQWRGFWTLALLSGLFIVLTGAGAALFMPRNPFSYLLLVLGLSVLPPLLLPQRERRGPGDVLDFRREEPDRKRTLH